MRGGRPWPAASAAPTLRRAGKHIWIEKPVLRSIAQGGPSGATLVDAVSSAEALDAMTASVESGSWVTVQAAARAMIASA